MRCFACGDHIPFWGERCPVCGEEKTRMQATRILGMGCMLACVVFGAMQAGWVGAIVVGLAGVVIWVLIEFVWNRLLRSKRKRKVKSDS
jgi:hypothetical protein